MTWGSASEFFAMGGYGFYVWGSFFVTAACMLVEPILLRRRMRRALEQPGSEVEQHHEATA
jgi:heme exporter protein D